MTQYLNEFCLFFPQSSRIQIVTFSLEQKNCDFLGKCDYYEWRQFSNFHKQKNDIHDNRLLTAFKNITLMFRLELQSYWVL